MREFIYFSNSARTSGNFPLDRLMDAGRLDIAIHVMINAFFLSHKLRDDTKIHLIFNGPPNPPQHLELFPGENISIPETGKSAGSDKLDISKKDIGSLIKKMLYKSNNTRKTTVWPGYTIEKKSLFKVLDDLEKEEKEIFKTCQRVLGRKTPALPHRARNGSAGAGVCHAGPQKEKARVSGPLDHSN